MSTKHFPIVSTWDDVQSNIIDKYILRRGRKGGNEDLTLSSSNRSHLFSEINTKLKNSAYKHSTTSSRQLGAINSIKYVFWEIRSGIFVSIRNNKIEAFIPFANARFSNDWHSGLTFYGIDNESITNPKDRVAAYLANKKKVLGFSRRMTKDPKRWWANAHFLNVETHPDIWGQHSLPEYFDMISTTLKLHKVVDNQFIINKRDHPILRADMKNPYQFLFKGDAPSIKSGKSFIPFVTPYSNPEYLDIAFPVIQDWLLASNPSSYYEISKDVPWNEKKEVAFFRGSATGRVHNNQRIMLASINSPLIDVGITSWNLSDKIDSNGFVEYMIPKNLESMGVKLKSRVEMHEQVAHKYIINVHGHSAPNRTTWILQSGCLMLMVDPVRPDYTWLDNNLKAWKHYVPIKSDLSDLIEKIKWCKSNDDECRKIVSNAKLFVRKYCSIETITLYIAYLMNQSHYRQ